MQPAINALPLTALCNGLRAVIVDGAGSRASRARWSVMAVWGAISFVIGLRAVPLGLTASLAEPVDAWEVAGRVGADDAR